MVCFGYLKSSEMLAIAALCTIVFISNAADQLTSVECAMGAPQYYGGADDYRPRAKRAAYKPLQGIPFLASSTLLLLLLIHQMGWRKNFDFKNRKVHHKAMLKDVKALSIKHKGIFGAQAAAAAILLLAGLFYFFSTFFPWIVQEVKEPHIYLTILAITWAVASYYLVKPLKGTP